MQNITISSYSTYDIKNYTNLINYINIIPYSHTSNKNNIIYQIYAIKNCADLIDYVDIIQYPYISSKYYISHNITHYLVSQYKLSPGIQINLLSQYLIGINNIQNINGLYSIQHSYYDILQKYDIKYDLILTTINSLYKIYSDPKIISINAEYRITHNIINQLYSILHDYTYQINIDYTIENFSTLIINFIYKILSSYTSYININYKISYNQIKSINGLYSIITPIFIQSKYGIKKDVLKQIVSKYGIIHARILALYSILDDKILNITNVYDIITNKFSNFSLSYSILNKVYSLSQYNIFATKISNIISTYSIPHIVNIISNYNISRNYIYDIKSLYNIINIKNKIYNYLSQYNILATKISNIISTYSIPHTINIISNYIIPYNYTYNINSIYIISGQKTKQILSIYNIQRTISHIYISKDKYKYNLNNTGLILNIDYNTKIINSLMNEDFITTEHIIKIISSESNQYHYDIQFNSNNINLQFIIDNYRNKNYIYQVQNTTDLSTQNSNKFVIIQNNDGTYNFKTNYKFSSNKEYYPYHIYLLSSIQIQYQISNSVKQKQIRKLYLIQDNPSYNSTINVICNNKYVKLQKNYNINEKYYKEPANQLIFIPEEQRKYYNSYNNRIEIPIKVIIYKKYIHENSILVPIIIDIDEFTE